MQKACVTSCSNITASRHIHSSAHICVTFAATWLAIEGVPLEKENGRKELIQTAKCAAVKITFFSSRVSRESSNS